MKKTSKLLLSVFLSCVLLCVSLLPAYATNEGVSTYLTNCSNSTMSFTVADGEANFYVSYVGRAASFTQAKLTVQIQKKFLGLFWRDAADEWVSYNTDLNGYFYDYIPVDGTGTYRAVFKLEVFGSTGVTDVIEDTIDVKYS